MARNRQTAWRVEGYRQEIRDHGGLLPQARGQEGTAFPDRRVFRHGGFVAVRGQAHAPQAAPYRQTRVRQALDHIGMVPRVLVLDNATGAGLRVAWNKVTVVRVFAMFCDHYRLETRSCNPYSGNEKGSVENAVGFLRRNLMAPSPTRRATDS